MVWPNAEGWHASNFKCANPEAPAVYASDSGPADMRSGEVNYAAPEYPLTAAALAQMARYYDLPGMVAHGSSEELPVDLTAFERNVLRVLISLATWTDLSSWMGSRDSAISGSLANLVMDAEVYSHAAAYLRQFSADAGTLALDVINEIGPAGHFLSHKHTVRHFEKNSGPGGCGTVLSWTRARAVMPIGPSRRQRRFSPRTVSPLLKRVC